MSALMFFQAMVLAGLFIGTVYGVGLAVVYKMVKNDNSSTTMSIVGTLVYAIAFFSMLLYVLK